MSHRVQLVLVFVVGIIVGAAIGSRGRTGGQAAVSGSPVPTVTRVPSPSPLVPYACRDAFVDAERLLTDMSDLMDIMIQAARGTSGFGLQELLQEASEIADRQGALIESYKAAKEKCLQGQIR